MLSSAGRLLVGRSLVTIIQRIALLLMLVPAVGQAATAVRLESSGDEFVGNGETRLFTDASSTFEVNSVFYNHPSFNRIQVKVFSPSGFSALTFRAPLDQFLSPGQRFVGVSNDSMGSPTRPAMNVSSIGRACAQLDGYFEVLELQWSPTGQVERLALNFKQFCRERNDPLYGAVRFNSDIPLDLPELQANAWADTNGAYTGDTVYLVPRFGYFRTAEDVTVSWEQVSGPPVQLTPYNSYISSFEVPLVKPGGERIAFRLTVQTPSRRSDDDVTEVHLLSRSDEQTFMEFESEPGEYIALGRSFRQSERDARFTPALSAGGGIRTVVTGNDEWRLDFVPPPGTTLTPGSYDNATDGDDAALAGNGIAISGAGRGCTSSGRFEVLDLVWQNGQPDRFAIDFEHRCDSRPETLRGRLRYRYLPVGIPAANAGSDQSVVAGDTVALDGTASSDDEVVTTYMWRQISGAPVTTTGANTSRASFTAPAASVPQTFSFELVVGDKGDLTAVDSVSIQVAPKASASPTPPPSGGGSEGGGGGGGGALNLLTLAICFVLAALRAWQRPRLSLPPRTGDRFEPVRYIELSVHGKTTSVLSSTSVSATIA